MTDSDPRPWRCPRCGRGYVAEARQGVTRPCECSGEFVLVDVDAMDLREAEQAYAEFKGSGEKAIPLKDLTPHAGGI